MTGAVGDLDYVVNITVHGIGPVQRELAPGEAEFWVTTDQFEQVLDAVVGHPAVRLSFDDANSSDVEIALPRLIERGLTADFFLLAGFLGQPGRVTVPGVRELQRAGMRIGSHGWCHRDWRKINPTEAVQEMADASRVLTQITGTPMTSAAIPFGSYDRHVLRLLRDAGFDRVYNSNGGPARRDAWLQSRDTLHHQIDAAWIDDVVCGRAAAAKRARRIAARSVKRVRGRP